MEKLIFKGIVGSRAFGTNTENSDTDIAEIYMCDNDDLLGLTYKEHDDIDKDNRRYELNKFIKLLMVGNPNMLEILNLPEDCKIMSSDTWYEIQKVKNKFITKNLYNTFAGYAKTQINKATGLNKKINWESQKVERKSVLDFCYIYPLSYTKQTQAIHIPTWLHTENYKQEHCGLVGLDHFQNTYLIYIDELQWVKDTDNPRYKDIPTNNFRGIVKEDSNDVHTSSVPEHLRPKGILYFNKDGYSMHCKDYNEYQIWLKNRNPDRYNINKKHGQKYDSKNIMHLVRLMGMAREIATKGIIKVRRTSEEVEFLLGIKNGKFDLKKLVDEAIIQFEELKELFDQSDLPDSVDEKFCHDLIINLRK